MTTLTRPETSSPESAPAPATAPDPESAPAPASTLPLDSLLATALVPVQRVEEPSPPGQVLVLLPFPHQARHQGPDPLPQQAITPTIPRYRNGVGMAAYGTALAALVLCWAPFTRDLAIILALTGLVLTGLAVLHAHVGIANNTALAAVAGLSCLAALALPGVVTTVVVDPAKAAEGGIGTGHVDYSACLARSYTTEQANACH